MQTPFLLLPLKHWKTKRTMKTTANDRRTAIIGAVEDMAWALMFIGSIIVLSISFLN